MADKPTRDKYGQATVAFLDDMRPHEKAIQEAIKDLVGKGYREAEIHAALAETVSFEFLQWRMMNGMRLRKQEEEARNA